MTLKYLNLTGLNALVSAIKTWVLSRIPTKTSELTNDASFITANSASTTYAPISHNHDASEITSGTIDIARLPPAALERLITVADQTARYALTTSTVQEGDTVKQADTGVMYLVVDSTKLNSADGYTEYSAGTASKAIADEDGNAIKSSYGKLAGANTWTQTQTFQSNINLTNTSYTIGTIPSTTAISACYFTGASNSQFGYCRAIVYKTTGQTSAVLAARNRFTNGALSPTGAYVNATFTVNLDADGTGWIQFEDCSIKNDLIPYTTDTYSIGTSTKKWKTLNGINPGALSLPDFTSETGVSLSAGANTYTPVLSGWLSISTTGDISVVCGNFCHKATDMISVPVIAGKTYTVTMPASATGYFYSCLGNV